MKTQYIALAWFLILVTIGIIVVLSIAIVVRRGVARRKSRIDRNVYTPYGYGLSKVWKESVERRINSTVRIRTEPPVFGEHYQKNWDKYIQEKQVTFLFRAKTVDDFLKLKEYIRTLCPDLEAPPIRGIHAFLMMARERVMVPTAPRAKIEEYCRLYLWARHDLDPFEDEQYQQFSKIHNELMQYVSRAATTRISSHSLASKSSSRHGSAKLLSFNSRFMSFSKNQSRHTTKQSHVFSGSQPGLSITGSDLSDATNRSKDHASQPSLIQLAHVHRCGRSDEPRLHTSTVCSTSADNPITVHMPDNGSVAMTYTSRRGSGQSDGSQTALINTDPQVHVITRGPTQVSRRSRSNEAFETIELKPMLHSQPEYHQN